MSSTLSSAGADPTGAAPADSTSDAVAEPVELDVEDAPERSGPRTRLVAAAVCLAIGLAALVNSYQLGVGTLTAPGAGLWPAGASAITVAASIILLVGFRRTDDCERFGHSTLTIGLATASLGVFVLLFGGVGGWPGIGFEWSMAALLAFWLKVVGGESWRVTVGVTVACIVVLHLFFIEMLGAPIPHVIGW
jgi:putative tricarboxylic transport membrane protein